MNMIIITSVLGFFGCLCLASFTLTGGSVTGWRVFSLGLPPPLLLLLLWLFVPVVAERPSP
jgi:hypothetical protein